MAYSQGKTQIDGTDKESLPALETIPTLSEAEFGMGITDRTYRQKIWSGMGRLFQQETLGDVMLMAEGRSISCHKFILAAASEYFYNKLVVENDTVNHCLLEIEGISFSALEVIVSYVYTGNINITTENARDVIPACKMLKLKSAFDICVKIAFDTINPGNCLGLHSMANAHDLQDLREKALNMMVNNFIEVVSGRKFLKMSEKDVEDYIQNENLKIPNEDPVFEAVVTWVRHQPQERESSFCRLVTHVRLRYCSLVYLTQVVNNEPMMENLQCQKILVAALVHHTATAIAGGSKQLTTAPRKGYTREITLMILGGTYDPGNVSSTDCWRLEESGWKMMEQCPMPASVEIFSACVMKEGILVTGGYHDGGKPVSHCWLLSTSTYMYQWRPLNDLKTARARHASVCVGGQVYVIAGEGENGKLLSSGECLQRLSNKWKRIPDLPKALEHPMTVPHGHYVYVFGGADIKKNLSQSVFVYGTNSKSWQTLADMPQICEFGSAVVWKDRIYIVGGFHPSCMSYDPVLAQWSTLAQCRHEHAEGPALVWNGRILVCGGRRREANHADDEAGGTSVIEEYDAETDAWTVSHIELPQRLSSHVVFTIQTSI